MPFNRPIPEPKQRRSFPVGLDSLVQAEKMIQIALVLPSAVVLGWLGGAWLDARFHHSWFTLTGIVLGSIAGMMSAIRMAIASLGEPGTGKKSNPRTEKGNPGKHYD